jgi:AraC-like DNA-binding protein
MRIPHDTATIAWLLESSDPVTEIRADQGDVFRMPIPLPADMGNGWFSKFELPMGMVAFCSEYAFLPKAVGTVLKLGEVSIPLQCEALMLQTMLRGRSLQTDHIVGKEFFLGPGYNIFRYGNRFRITPSVDCTADASMIGLLVTRTALNLLIGAVLADRLLTALEIVPPPRALVHAIPQSVSSHLQQAIPHHMTGKARGLFIQARALDYLTALIEHLGINQSEETYPGTSQWRVDELYSSLIHSQGKLPTLGELAERFGVSAQTLNRDFKAVYGQTIHQFIMDFRLTEAHAAIQQNDIPLKTLAQKLGYRHANHFLTAFRKKFGYSPGSLRTR